MCPNALRACQVRRLAEASDARCQVLVVCSVHKDSPKDAKTSRSTPKKETNAKSSATKSQRPKNRTHLPVPLGLHPKERRKPCQSSSAGPSPSAGDLPEHPRSDGETCHTTDRHGGVSPCTAERNPDSAHIVALLVIKDIICRDQRWDEKERRF